MHIATFEINGARRLGLISTGARESIIDLGAAAGLLKSEDGSFETPRNMLALIQSSADPHDRLNDLAARAEDDTSLQKALVNRENVKLCAPIERPGKIICLAGNYREHITESGFVAPEQTDIITQQLFLKPSTGLTGDGEDIVIERNNVAVGWEAELAVVIGKRGKHITYGDAYDHVFGYTILNDISERRLNSRIENRHRRELDSFFDWLAGKWFDTFAPCGPWIVTADEIADPHDLEIKLTVNGETRQQGNTSDMIFSIPEQIAYASSIMTLEPGDIISTGTPVGAGLGGATSLRDGDELVCEIEHIGTLRNRVRCDK
ncbi:MAG: fumarylacetoacetate hydrolase family protein [Acidobacteriota bacterium]|nr:fumarylacetoacetate hydrolase family protein [Acidobacteriota bacterium]